MRVKATNSHKYGDASERNGFVRLYRSGYSIYAVCNNSLHSCMWGVLHQLSIQSHGSGYAVKGVSRM